MLNIEYPVTLADTKSDRWKRLCPPDAGLLGPTGLKSSALQDYEGGSLIITVTEVPSV